MSNTSNYLPNLLGPVILADDGTALPSRKTINFTGGVVTDDEVNDRLNVALSGGGGGASGSLDNASTGALTNVATLVSTTPVETVRFTGVAPTVSGFTDGTEARRLIVTATGGPLVLANQGAGSTAANRIITGTGASVTIDEGGGALLEYDVTTARWRLISSAGGGGTVADDIAKSAGTNIDRVHGLRGITITGTDGVAPAVGAVPVYNAVGTATYKMKNPSPPGWYDVTNYGATGDGVTNDGPAIRTTVAAMTTGGTLYFPPGTYKVSTRDESSTDKDIHNAGVSIDACIHILGPSGMGGAASVVFASGLSGFVFEYPNAQSSSIENLDIRSTVARPSTRLDTTAYVAGDKVSRAGENRYHFACTTSGTTGDTAAGLAAFGDPATNGGWVLNTASPITDGTAVFAPRIHAGLVFKAIVHGRHCTIASFTNCGLHYQAGGIGTEWDSVSLTDSASFRSSVIASCGTSMWCRGNDTNNMLMDTLLSQTPGAGQAAAVTAGVGLWIHAGLGTVALNCYTNSGTGRGFIVDTPAGYNNSLISCSSEHTDASHVISPASVVGGNPGPGFTDTSTATILLSTGGRWINEIDDRAGNKNLRGYLGYPAHATPVTMAFSNSDENALTGIMGWRYGLLADGYWAFSAGGVYDQQTAFWVTGKSVYSTRGRGWLGTERGLFVGLSAGGTATYFDGPVDSLTSRDLRTGSRLQGDRFRLSASATAGRWICKTVTSAGYRGVPWTTATAVTEDSPTYGIPATIVEPTVNGSSPAGGLQVWKCTTQGTTHATTEPVWPVSPTPGVTTQSDGTVTWTYLGVTPTMAFTERVDSASVDQTPQASTKWKDSSDTGTTSSKTGAFSRRRQVQTTTATASQVLDDGGTYSGEDFTLTDNAITRVRVTLFVKKSTVAAGGTIDLQGDFYRDAAGNATRIGTDITPVYNLTGSTLDATTAILVINGTKVEVQASPESADTLDWGVFRTHLVGGAGAAI